MLNSQSPTHESVSKSICWGKQIDLRFILAVVIAGIITIVVSVQSYLWDNSLGLSPPSIISASWPGQRVLSQDESETTANTTKSANSSRKWNLRAQKQKQGALNGVNYTPLVDNPSEEDDVMIQQRKHFGLLPDGMDEQALLSAKPDQDFNEIHLLDLFVHEAEEGLGLTSVKHHAEYESYIHPISEEHKMEYNTTGFLQPPGAFAKFNSVCSSPNKPTEYCSIGEVRGFIGSIDDVDNVKAMLEARQFKQELILLMCDMKHIDLPLNAIFQLRARGYEHYVLLMLSEDECLQAAEIVPGIGCVWSNFLLTHPPPKYWHDVRRLWMIRWMLILRIIQNSVNVLMMDSDNGVLHDVYAYMKTPLFTRYNLITPYEPNLPGINCGAIYIQGAKPNGPIAWMAAEVAERSLRWLENIEWLEDRLPAAQLDPTWIDTKALFEQDIFNDAACSAIAGRPLYYNTLSPHQFYQEKDYDKWTLLHNQLCGEWLEQETQLPESWTNINFSNETAKLLYNMLTLPAAYGDWPEHLGGYPYPPHRGKLSLLGQMWIRAGAPDPMWPMPEDHEDPNGLRTSRHELVLRTPPWLFSRWPETGFVGWWDPKLRRDVSGVLAHTIVMQGNDGEGKVAPFKTYGWWHWEVNAILHGKMLYRASTPEAPIPKVIALAPEVNMFTVSEEHLFQLAHHLARAAVLSGRKLVWPKVHCLSPWIRRPTVWQKPDNDPLPIHDHRIMAYGGLKDLTCVTFLFMSIGCHEVGMPYYDFEHMMKSLPKESIERRAENTILLDKLPTYIPPKWFYYSHKWQVPTNLEPPPETAYRVDGKQLKTVLDAMSDEPVVWVGAPLLVDKFPKDMEDGLLDFMRVCSKKELRHNPLLTENWWLGKFPDSPAT